jgi:hypothetical protein
MAKKAGKPNGSESKKPGVKRTAKGEAKCADTKTGENDPAQGYEEFLCRLSEKTGISKKSAEQAVRGLLSGVVSFADFEVMDEEIFRQILLKQMLSGLPHVDAEKERELNEAYKKERLKKEGCEDLWKIISEKLGVSEDESKLVFEEWRDEYKFLSGESINSSIVESMAEKFIQEKEDRKKILPIVTQKMRLPDEISSGQDEKIARGRQLSFEFHRFLKENRINLLGDVSPNELKSQCEHALLGEGIPLLNNEVFPLSAFLDFWDPSECGEWMTEIWNLGKRGLDRLETGWTWEEFCNERFRPSSEVFRASLHCSNDRVFESLLKEGEKIRCRLITAWSFALCWWAREVRQLDESGIIDLPTQAEHGKSADADRALREELSAPEPFKADKVRNGQAYPPHLIEAIKDAGRMNPEASVSEIIEKVKMTGKHIP